ncbi:MAG: lipoprotein signal peptidase [Bacteroidales bacterium]|nr:lipoprotein signal peptidase [Bacteroidales bacterium]
MNKQRRYTIVSIGVILALIVIDQIIKIVVKTNMCLGETIPVLGNWFNICFVENEGMAFGLSWGHNIGKLVLSLLRVVLIVLLCWYLHKRIKAEKMDGMQLAIFCMVIAGAFGNIIDSLFYGLIFSESTPLTVAQAFAGGYAPFMFGKVVDMFYFPLFILPDWFPLWGGSYFFPAIFNFADACITVGLILMLIFNKRFFSEDGKKDEEVTEEEPKTENV